MNGSRRFSSHSTTTLTMAANVLIWTSYSRFRMSNIFFCNIFMPMTSLSPSDKSLPAHPVVFLPSTLCDSDKKKRRSKHTNWNFTGPVNNCTHLGLFICARTLFTLSRHVLCITYEGGEWKKKNILEISCLIWVFVEWECASLFGPSARRALLFALIQLLLVIFDIFFHASTFSHLRRVWARQTTGCWAGVN